jgi:phosphatidate cytidylyltransferase
LPRKPEPQHPEGDGSENAEVAATDRLEVSPAPETQPFVEDTAAPVRQTRSLKLSIVTGLTLSGLALGTLFLGRGAFFALAFVVILLAQSEFYLATKRAGYEPAIALGLVTGGVLLLGAYLRGEPAAALVLFLGIAFSFIWYLASERRSGNIPSLGITLLGVGYVPLFGAFGALMLRRPDGIGVIIATIGAAALYDTLAYVGGLRWGRRALAKAISPKKTVEGALIATAGTVFVGTLAVPYLGPWSPLEGFAFSALVCLFAPVGDLVESLIKRDLEIKDMGAIFPGHGGALDRLDAILFSALGAYLSLRLFGL